MNSLNDKKSLDRKVAVPDHDVLREEQINPEDRERKNHFTEIVHHGRIGEEIVRAQALTEHDRYERHRGQSAPEASGEKELAETRAPPDRCERHNQIECD